MIMKIMSCCRTCNICLKFTDFKENNFQISFTVKIIYKYLHISSLHEFTEYKVHKNEYYNHSSLQESTYTCNYTCLTNILRLNGLIHNQHGRLTIYTQMQDILTGKTPPHFRNNFGLYHILCRKMHKHFLNKQVWLQ